MTLEEENVRILLQTQCQFVKDKLKEMNNLVLSQEENTSILTLRIDKFDDNLIPKEKKSVKLRQQAKQNAKLLKDA